MPQPQGPRPDDVPPEEVAPGAPPGQPGRYEIALGTPPGRPARGGPPAFAKPPAAKPAKTQTGDSGLRETVETVVFVVVLVLLLKTFLAEAFVIPTGSMATTLLGYHIETTCEQCGHRYLFNASSEAEPGGPRGYDPVEGSYCENCGFINLLPRAGRKEEAKQ